ncbi:hypothetical protein A9R05_05310 [Burkholderia sp. KK1]|nr:hypothetical protein A9R05_05310 [Burkholderia sp. KK1]
MSIVRENLMTVPGYTPYCARDFCWRRSTFNGSQFECPVCNWASQFDPEFIEAYKAKWSKQDAQSGEEKRDAD